MEVFMKKLFCLLVLSAMVLSSVAVFADEEIDAKVPENSIESVKADSIETKSEKALENDVTIKNTSNKVILDIKLLPRMQVIDSFAKVELKDENGISYGEKVEWVGGITEKLHFEYEVPEYTLGKTFRLYLVDGLSYIKYYDDVIYKGGYFDLTTYGYTDDKNEFIAGNSFAFDASPMYEHLIILYVEGRQIKLNPKAKLIDEIAMVPVKQTAEEMGIEVRYDEQYRSVVCLVGDKKVFFNLGSKYATFLDKDVFMPKECMDIDDVAYVPVRSLCEAFSAPVEAIDFGDHIDVCVGESETVKTYMSQFPVNNMNISSRTNYMVWVDKSDYRVRVYKGSKNKWKQLKAFPCAIGAPNSPTITGSFEYEYRVGSWDYPGYYVGPCLVFYGNYAIHSTLLRYDGTPYDNRVECMISHGCVRIHKEDINWLSANLPIGSRVYVTE